MKYYEIWDRGTSINQFQLFFHDEDRLFYIGASATREAAEALMRQEIEHRKAITTLIHRHPERIYYDAEGNPLDAEPIQSPVEQVHEASSHGRLRIGQDGITRVPR